MKTFDHEKLDVYGTSIEFLIVVDAIAQELPRGRAYLRDQLRRAPTSVPLNIAEGAGEYSKSEKARFYRMAKRSAIECAAILDVCRCSELIEQDKFEKGHELLIRIVSMLIKMIRTKS